MSFVCHRTANPIALQGPKQMVSAHSPFAKAETGGYTAARSSEGPEKHDDQGMDEIGVARETAGPDAGLS
jgi:hypothetical protein